MGGSDQWGNITAGIDLIRKVRAQEGARARLAADEDGVGREVREDRGRERSGSIPARTSPFRFYQFWLNTDDRDVVTYLKYFTFLDRAAIDGLEAVTTSAPEKREAQRVLAREVTALVHGADQLARAEHASTVLFGEDITTLTVDEVLAVFEDVPSTELPADVLGDSGIGMVDLVARVGLAPSRGEARRLVQSGGVYVNNRRMSDPQARLTREQAIGGRLFVLRRGQKHNHLVRMT